MTIETIKTWNKEIEDAISLKIDPQNPDELSGKLNALSNLTGLSSQCVALSERFYNDKIAQLFLAPAYKLMSATEKKMIFASLAAEEQYLVTLSERLNKGLTHSADMIRSILSALKEEMKAVKSMAA